MQLSLPPGNLQGKIEGSIYGTKKTCQPLRMQPNQEE